MFFPSNTFLALERGLKWEKSMNGLEGGMWFYENQVYWSCDPPFGYEFGGLYVLPPPTPNYGDEKWFNDLVPLLEELRD